MPSTRPINKLHNVEIICPEIANYIINCYTLPARLFITGGKELLSTQGDPVAMGMYAIGLMPMLTMLTINVKDLIKIAFADDLTGMGQILQML